jgi:serine/threonine-protein kinase ULK2
MNKAVNSETYKIIDNYIMSLKDVLGSGAYGTVYGGTLSDKKVQIAVKQISLAILNKKNSDKIFTSLKSEIANMRLLNHPNIVRLLDVKKSANNLYLIMEFCNEGSLEGYLTKNLGRLSEAEGLKMITELVSGYEALYRNNIVHRDLKPANILLHDGVAKLGDFGFSKVVVSLGQRIFLLV